MTLVLRKWCNDINMTTMCYEFSQEVDYNSEQMFADSDWDIWENSHCCTENENTHSVSRSIFKYQNDDIQTSAQDCWHEETDEKSLHENMNSFSIQ